jgi:Hint domain
MTTYTWISVTSADWSTASDWSPAGGPGSGGVDAAPFGARGPAYTVTYKENPTLLSVALLDDTSPNATIDVNTGDLTTGALIASKRTNFVDLAGVSFAITSGGTGSGTSGTILLSNGDTLAPTRMTNAHSAAWYAQTVADGSGGTDVFLGSVSYAAGTRILTDGGERAVETLRPGDIVITLSQGQRHERLVKWIGRRRVDLTAHPRPEMVVPIRIRRGAVADDMPHRDLVVSPEHAILIDGKLVSARRLVNGMTIRRDDALSAVDYFHVELGAHAILLAEGLPAESHFDTGNRGFFANCDAALGLHPDLYDELDYASREQASCEPFVWDEDSVGPIWQRLADRAIVLGEVPPMLDTTTDPGLHLVVHGRKVKPLCAEAGRHLFLLPKEASEVRVVSLAAAPTVGRPWVEDRRRLGVCVERIILRSADDTEQIPIPLDHPDLSQGWWAAEREGMRLRRWTNGDARLRLPAGLDSPVLELHAGWDGMSYSIPARPKLIATPARPYRHEA